MTQRNYYKLVSGVFLVIGVLHLVRIVNGWEAVISGVVIPMWVSWAAVAIAGYLAFRGWQFAKGRR